MKDRDSGTICLYKDGECVIMGSKMGFEGSNSRHCTLGKEGLHWGVERRRTDSEGSRGLTA